MNTISVRASKEYSVIIGSGLHSQLGDHLRSLNKSGKTAIISDSNVWPLYGETVTAALLNADFEVCSYVFPAGEDSKNGNTFLSILNFLAENKLTRTDCVIALGGGVVGDITGFAASAYLRGISYIQIPTTLLAMVDSSVGGKTAIDLPAGKNLAGAFYQPDIVLCDIDALNTLPQNIFRDGCAEIIKYGILYDAQLFSHLEANGLDFDRSSVVTRCIALKRDVVSEDEFDRGARQKLNLGHTVGHGVESQSDFTISHGQAVAIGIHIVSKAAVAYKICSEQTYLRIRTVLEKFRLPTNTEYTAEDLYTSALSDKKRSGNTVNLIIPEKIGFCRIQATPVLEMKQFI